ncbi:NAD-dependent epimerase/dehydratase family protein [Solirubrobacter soli]|uniref:NAD-dependent epimerase/dehydratase family protein n=1 Tax=Solirubrobacter soli TaxID=363832 RepID=UPI00069EC4DA|nr:NAD-dependent epimerase/dehydratase family protein [Solirubrobacter soli]
MWAGKRVLITGGAGVIGTALVAKLLEQGAELWVGDLKPRPRHWDAGIRYRRGDLNSLTAAELAAFAPEVVFHLAATFERTVETYDFFEPTSRHNVRLSNHLVSLLKDRPDVRKVVFASSYLAYDSARYVFAESPEEPVRLREDDAIAPRNVCGAAKLLHEVELEFFQGFRPEVPGFDAVSARIFRVYGRGSRDVVSRWVRAALAGEPIEVYRPDGMFDYVLADDVAEGLMRLAASDATGVVNLATGQARRVAEVVEVLKANIPELVATVGETPEGLGAEASAADTTRLRELIGWAPTHRIEDGIPLLIEHERHAAPEVEEAIRAGVLVTSSAAKVPLLQSVRAALEDVAPPGAELHAGDLDERAITRWFADGFWAMPRIADLDAAQIEIYCRTHGIGLIVPTRDGELAFWARQRLDGVSVLVSSPEAIDVCLDKLAFAEAVPEAIPASLDLAALDGERFVVKERFGAGAANIGLDLDREAAQAHAATLDAPVFQPFVTGTEYSVDLYVARTGAVQGAVARRRELVKGGESQVTVTVEAPELEALCARIATDLGVRGPAVLQVLDDGERLHVIECNPRFGGASTLGIAAGLEPFAWAWLEAAGESLESRPFRRRPGEHRQVRYAADLVLPA